MPPLAKRRGQTVPGSVVTGVFTTEFPGLVPTSPGGMVKFLRADGTWQPPAGGGGSVDWADITGKPSTFPPSAHSHVVADVTGLQTALDNKLDDSQAGAGGLSVLGAANAAAVRTAAGLVIGTDVQAFDSDLASIAALTTTAYGRGLLTTADAAALTALLNAATASLPGAMSAQDKARLDASFTRWHSLLDCSGSHIAGRVAGTYGMGQGDPLAISGTGTLYPLNSIYLASADYPVAGTLNPKLRLRVGVYCNDVAPTGNYTFGLHPITRPATSGGAGLNIFTIGAAVATSTIAFNTPAADSSNQNVSAEFALPSDGHYVIGMVSTATVATSAHMHVSALLQMRYS